MIDKRIKYLLVLDVETAGDVETNPLCYDIGGQITDRKGNVYQEFSFLVSEVFDDDAVMRTAYYNEKIPLYKEKLKNGIIELRTIRHIRYFIGNLIDKYNVKKIGAYNSSFDFRALNNTWFELTSQKFFFQWKHKNIERFCIWNMSCQTIFLQKGFPKWAIENGHISEKGNLKTSAEVAYNWLLKTENFIEEHTGLEDVKIETRIMSWCNRQNKKVTKGINKYCWQIPNEYHKEKVLSLV